MPKKGKQSDLGRALARRRERDAKAARSHTKTAAAQMAAATGRHTVDFVEGTKLQSILDATDLEELMLNATMASEDFAAERYARPLAPQTVVVTRMTDRLNKQEMDARRELNRTALRIPRRPKWDVNTTYEQLMKNETEEFLNWRRAIASIEEEHSLASTIGGAMMTPFEKNLEVWRQLWRVVERSDVVVQIVDARNPLLYYCEDMYRYVTEEMGRSHLLLLNKSDLLSANMIEKWRQYFNRRKIDAVFFSAFSASVREEARSEHVIGVHELVKKLSSYERRSPQTQANQRLVVGMCGYPNVGKSSTINVLLETMAERSDSETSERAEEGAVDVDGEDSEIKNGMALTSSTQSEVGSTQNSSEATVPTREASKHHKRVGVSSTPGKTKHFQTLILSDKVLLCDCPGLVFPNFSSSKAELICAGVLSIDTMRGDYITSVSLIAQRIPAATLEGVYGLRFASNTDEGVFTDGGVTVRDGYVTGACLLDTHARARGFMSDHNKADESRSARVLLKDFVSGRIIYMHGPPAEGGESGIGPDVFAKKGKVVYARTEARKASAESGTNDGVDAEGGVEESMDVHGAVGSGKGEVKARLSGGKKYGGQEFKRVERSFTKR
ncbi:Large subunit GTPase 1 [Gracilariopsis chorda]|uniref:Large subunit GTPase 1 n=1 Tax=Gracilariopsis chorda TaxID=448386 RepID=A0A2V3ISL7_9FLOR|nr:Large subunit GTPase 1 [Gracilariopsis chorda]|eukprot:PXF45118.1 Large subunit GTPase 1 [Gracilariopsis chorda]